MHTFFNRIEEGFEGGNGRNIIITSLFEFFMSVNSKVCSTFDEFLKNEPKKIFKIDSAGAFNKMDMTESNRFCSSSLMVKCTFLSYRVIENFDKPISAPFSA